MHIIFLKFGPKRSEAGQWMTEHKQWIDRGVADGVFLLAGSLDAAQGGVVLAAGTDGEAIRARVAEDPFVKHGVVIAELYAVTPSRLASGMGALLGHAQPATTA